MSHQIQHKIALICNVPDDDIDDCPTSYRSIWKPSHGFNGGLLYRINEQAIIVTNQDGEVCSQIQKIFRVSVAEQNKYFLCCKPFEEVIGNNNGGRLVQTGLNTIVIATDSISYKVMLARADAVNGHTAFLVVDYMRRIFSVRPGTVVVHYFPCVHDMVLVRGDHEQTVWRARVVLFLMRRQEITGCFFQQRPDGLWEPGGSQNQQTLFDSILSIVKGTWIVQFSSWQDL